MYGLRNVGDIDYITNSSEKNFPREVGDNHNGYLYFHETSADDLIFNPRNYLYFEGMKVVSLEQVASMKKMRGGEVGKDLMDVLLTEKIFSKRLETLNEAVMEFINYFYSAKGFNMDQVFEHLEPIFSQEGWRTKNFLRGEEKILVICNYVTDDIVGVNNFLKNLREKKPTAKITFLTDVRSQKLMSNLKYADKIISLDTTFEQDILWQICKFVELCRNCLWQEYFSTCCLLNLENNFSLAILFGYLSGSFSRIGFVKNVQAVSEDLKKFGRFLTTIYASVEKNFEM